MERLEYDEFVLSEDNGIIKITNVNTNKSTKTDINGALIAREDVCAFSNHDTLVCMTPDHYYPSIRIINISSLNTKTYNTGRKKEIFIRHGYVLNDKEEVRYIKKYRKDKFELWELKKNLTITQVKNIMDNPIPNLFLSEYLIFLESDLCKVHNIETNEEYTIKFSHGSIDSVKKISDNRIYLTRLPNQLNNRLEEEEEEKFIIEEWNIKENKLIKTINVPIIKMKSYLFAKHFIIISSEGLIHVFNTIDNTIYQINVERLYYEVNYMGAYKILIAHDNTRIIYDLIKRERERKIVLSITSSNVKYISEYRFIIENQLIDLDKSEIIGHINFVAKIPVYQHKQVEKRKLIEDSLLLYLPKDIKRIISRLL